MASVKKMAQEWIQEYLDVTVTGLVAILADRGEEVWKDYMWGQLNLDPPQEFTDYLNYELCFQQAKNELTDLLDYMEVDGWGGVNKSNREFIQKEAEKWYSQKMYRICKAS